MGSRNLDLQTDRPAVLFDLDGTLLDSVYQHVLAWKEALESAGISLSIWRIHRRIGMSGGLFVRALVRETGHELSAGEADRLRSLHEESYAHVDEVRGDAYGFGGLTQERRYIAGKLEVAPQQAAA